MNPISDVKRDRSGRSGSTTRRSYSGSFRREQAAETRVRILEALVRTMSRGVAEVTIPAVADEAGVSVPTVYRHFGSKRELVAALSGFVMEKTRLMPEVPPRNLDDLPEMVRDMFRRHETMDATIRAAMASELGGALRREHMPARLSMVREAIRGSASDLSDEDLDRLALLVVLLLSSATMRAMKDYFGLTGDDAADRVAWAAQTLVRGARARAREE